MAVDSWLLDQHRLGLHPPTLRFYTWSPIAISLGYHQHRWPEFWHHLTWHGNPVELVRRPSGGRAVLHQGDLTYGIVTSGLMGSRIQVYQVLCEFLIAGWRSLGVELHYGSGKQGNSHNPNCFTVATGADLVTANGYKLIGSAQLYRDRAVLQHGSMRLQPDQTLFAQVFGEAERPILEPVMPQQRDTLIQTVIDALTEAAIRCFDIQIVTQPLSESEWQAIEVVLPAHIKPG